MDELGISVPESYIEQGEFSFQSGYDGMKKIYEENSILPTAIVAGSDLIALGAMQFLNSIGMSVPADMSIIGFDDLNFPFIQTRTINRSDSIFRRGTKSSKRTFKIYERNKGVCCNTLCST